MQANQNPALQAAIIAYEQNRTAAERSAYVAQRHAAGTIAIHLVDRDVCTLSESLARELGLPTVIRQVMLSYNSIQHVLQEHEISVRGEPDVVTSRIATALSSPRYVRKHPKPNRWGVIGFLGEASRYMCVGLKLVAAESSRSQAHELWATTAFYVGRNTLKKGKRSGDIQSLDLGAA
jgi:hypothetical protein